MFNPALTVQRPRGSLDLGGHTLSCGGSGATGIKLTASRGTVKNGTVFDCGDGVVLTGTSGHQVSNMTLENNSGNGSLISKGNGYQISDTISRDNGGRGFYILGGGSSFTGNDATNNGSHGYEAKGNSKFTSNRAEFNGIMGFQINGNANTLDNNTVDNTGRGKARTASISSGTTTRSRAILL